MNRKGFNGKAIYNPQGKAGEYSEWACNFYTGCSNNCDYCYCKRGFMSRVWSDKPQLKKCFKSEADALVVYEKELKLNLEALRKSGLFFTFTSDPFVQENGARETHMTAILLALSYGVPVQVLTKRADFSNSPYYNKILDKYKDLIAFGFTLTGHDELEPGASTNQERIQAMKQLHQKGFRTFASIEPVIDFDSSLRMIKETVGFCDLYKIGLMSGVKTDYFDNEDLCNFISEVSNGIPMDMPWNMGKVYWKESVRKCVKLPKNDPFWEFGNNVNSDYNIFCRRKCELVQEINQVKKTL